MMNRDDSSIVCHPYITSRTQRSPDSVSTVTCTHLNLPCQGGVIHFLAAATQAVPYNHPKSCVQQQSDFVGPFVLISVQKCTPCNTASGHRRTPRHTLIFCRITPNNPFLDPTCSCAELGFVCEHTSARHLGTGHATP